MGRQAFFTDEVLPGTTPALRLGPAEEELDPGLLDEEPLTDEPRGLLGADGPVAGVDGVAVGRDIAGCPVVMRLLFILSSRLMCRGWSFCLDGEGSVEAVKYVLIRSE